MVMTRFGMKNPWIFWKTFAGAQRKGDYGLVTPQGKCRCSVCPLTVSWALPFALESAGIPVPTFYLKTVGIDVWKWLSENIRETVYIRRQDLGPELLEIENFTITDGIETYGSYEGKSFRRFFRSGKKPDGR